MRQVIYFISHARADFDLAGERPLFIVYLC